MKTDTETGQRLPMLLWHFLHLLLLTCLWSVLVLKLY